MSSLSVRGLVIGLIVLAFGATLVQPAPDGGVAWVDYSVLAFLFVGAMIGGAVADRMTEERLVREANRGNNRWMTVIVSCEGPSDAQEIGAEPSNSPYPAPERRSVARLARNRRRRRAGVLAD